MHLEVEPTGTSKPVPCSCCGHESQTVWGFVHQVEGTIAAYYVQWTKRRPQDGASFDLILGPWGDEASSADRVAVALEYRANEGKPGFMIIDATTRPIGSSELADRILSREDVVGSELASHAFNVIDAIWIQDRRIKEVTKWYGS